MTAEAKETRQTPDHQPPCQEFASPEDAVEIGYEIGRTLRDNGASKSKETMHLGKLVARLPSQSQPGLLASRISRGLSRWAKTKPRLTSQVGIDVGYGGIKDT